MIEGQILQPESITLHFLTGRPGIALRASKEPHGSDSKMPSVNTDTNTHAQTETRKTFKLKAE